MVLMKMLRSKGSFIWVGGYLFLLSLVPNIKARTVNFAGTEWIVKSGYGGPGPNYWSDSEENVWVDTDGKLHLKIRNIGETWYCSEVYTQRFTRYGMHRFYIICWLDSLDKNVVFAPFIYKDDTTEVDIEFAKWGISIPWYNAQYVIQPGQNPGNVERFLMQLNGTYTTHYMDWNSSQIDFKSIHGHYQEPPNPDYLIHEWLYTGNDIPLVEERLRVHINLWLYQGNAPSSGEEVEVIVKDADLPETEGVFGHLSVKPEKFILQNFPNPAFNHTVIQYSLPDKAQVRLRVFNTVGQEVRRLVDGTQEPGHYKVTWNIGGVSKKSLSSGIYFYRLEAGNYVKTKKLTILR